MAHAATQFLADQVQAQILHIKGVALDAAVTRPGRASSDADVLCRPSHVRAVVPVLQSNGWRLVNSFEKGSSFEHSATFWHENWGYLDLHRYYPGLGTDAEWAFDVLWASRSTVALAGVGCAVPSVPAQALILLLHAARSGADARSAADRAFLWDNASEDQRAQIRAAVDELGAELGFSVILGELDLHRREPTYELWRVASRGGTRLEEWRARFKAAPSVSAKLRVIVRAPLVNDEHLALTRGRPPRFREILVEFFARAHRAVREQYAAWKARRRAPEAPRG